MLVSDGGGLILTGVKPAVSMEKWHLLELGKERQLGTVQITLVSQGQGENKEQ